MAKEGSSSGVGAPGRSVLALLALLLASPFALLLGGPSSTGAPRSGAPASAHEPGESGGVSAGKPPGGRCIDRFLQPLYDVTATPPRAEARLSAALSAELTPSQGGPAQWASSLDYLHERLLDTPCLGVDAVIATVPDPTSSEMAYSFDTALQALRLAVEQAQPTPDSPRYYRDRQWLPWDDGGGGGEDSDRDGCRKAVPGIVVFRGGSTEKPRVMALLLVGESPTAGVHPAAMANALLLAKVLTSGGKREACRSDPGDRCPLCTKIIGPTFSGGASSLRQALDQWIHGQPDAAPVRIITGAATGDSVARVLREVDTPVAPEAVTFESTTVTAEATACAYYGFLTSRLGVNAAERAAARERNSPYETASDALAPELLRGVAMLHESGTEFGATLRAARCGFQAEVDISFPVHVSALRSAYDEADRRSEEQDPTIARPRTLQVSLAEKKKSREDEADMSQTTINARDLALTNILGAISRDGVRHVGIQATDIVDTIFLARRIRDVAPDVRLAFFDADALLSHESFRRDLAGSLVVSPYPFLGTNDFARPGQRPFEEIFAPIESPHPHMPFENSAAEGTFNAMLAVRGVPYDELREYTFDQAHHAPLPVWISTIGSRGIVPIAVTPALDCDRSIVGGAAPHERPAAERTLCEIALPGPEVSNKSPPSSSGSLEERRKGREQAWEKFYGTQASSLDLDRDATPPRVWHFVYAALVVGFLVDKVLQRRRRRRFSKVPAPCTLGAGDDERAAEDALLRTKWELYAFLRTYVLAFCLGYMSSVYGLVFGVYAFQWQRSLLGTWSPAVLVAVGALLVALADTASAFWRFLADYAVLARRFRSWSLLSVIVLRLGWVDAGAPIEAPVAETKGGSSDAFASAVGFREPHGRWQTAATSFAQIRALLSLSIVTIGAFVYWIGEQAWTMVQGAFPGGSPHAAPAMTLSVMRHLVLVDNVSPAGPLLLCAMCVYLWACGRMARLYALHALARMTPPGAMVDLVSTPMHAVCSPPGAAVDAQLAENRGLAAVEREVVNAIARPSTGVAYLLTLVVIIAFPLMLFALKPLSTLEAEPGTKVLGAALALSAILIGATLTQLVQYWLAMRNLLRRTMEHPIGQGLGGIAPYARDSLADLLSRPPDDQLRFVACARDFVGLASESSTLQSPSELRTAIDSICWAAPAVEYARGMALAVTPRGFSTTTFEQEAALGCAVLSSAAQLSELLREVSQGRVSGSGAPSDRKQAGSLETRDALSPLAWKFSDAELAWLQRAQGHVATVVALLVVRYVRHFRVFAYTLTACALVLLMAVESYPFEPHRLLLTGIWVVMLSVVVAGLWVYIELDQNGVMSRISGTEPGKVTLNTALVAHVLTWVVLPLLGVSAAQYPQVAKTLSQVVEPFAKALK